MQARLSLLDTSALDWDALAKAAAGLSHADITRACESAAKNAILNHRTVVDAAELVTAMTERQAAQG